MAVVHYTNFKRLVVLEAYKEKFHNIFFEKSSGLINPSFIIFRNFFENIVITYLSKTVSILEKILKKHGITKEVPTYRCHRNIYAKEFKELFYEIYIKEGIYEIRL